MCNECPECDSKNIDDSILAPKVVHNGTEIYVHRHCADCGSSFTSVFQFDRHDIKD